MIDIKEVRVGNFLKIDQQYGKQYENVIHAVQPTNFFMQLSGLEPILITAEILEKCGFVKVDHKYILYGFEYYNNCIWFDTTQIEVKYLHQLQNIYFALTGKELEVGLI